MPRVRVLRSKGVFEAGVRDVGVETDFHHYKAFFRDPEHLLSKWEREFAEEMKRWAVGSIDEKGRAVIDRFIPHLRLRSRTLRLLGTRLTRTFLSITDRGIAEELRGAQPAVSLRDHIGGVLEEAVRRAQCGTWDEASRQQLLDEVTKHAVQQHLSHWSILEAARLIREMMTEDTVEEMLSGIHTTVILAALMNQRKFEAFGDCRWEVREVRGGPLLLGDVGPLCAYHGYTRLMPLYAAATPLRAVMLPLGPKRLVVGWHGSRPKLPSIEAMNHATLELSHEFVVGTWAANRLRRQVDRLSTRAAQDTPEAILGMDATAGASFVAKAAQAIATWVAGRVDGYWSRTGIAVTHPPVIEARP